MWVESFEQTPQYTSWNNPGYLEFTTCWWKWSSWQGPLSNPLRWLVISEQVLCQLMCAPSSKQVWIDRYQPAIPLRTHWNPWAGAPTTSRTFAFSSESHGQGSYVSIAPSPPLPLASWPTWACPEVQKIVTWGRQRQYFGTSRYQGQVDDDG